MRQQKQRSDLGKRVQLRRQEKGFTQEMLAEESGVSLRTIQRIEQGSVKPQPYTLKAISSSLNYQFPMPVIHYQGVEEKADQDLQPVKRMILSSLVFFLPIIANVFIPMVIWYRHRHLPKIREYGGILLSSQILWSIITLTLLVLTPGVAQAVFGESNPGNFHPLLAVYMLMIGLNSFLLMQLGVQLEKRQSLDLKLIPNFF